MRLARISNIDKKKGVASVVYIQTGVASVKLPIIAYILPDIKVKDLVLIADTDEGYSIVIGKIFDDKFTPDKYKKEHEEHYEKLLRKLHPKIDEEQFASIAGKKCKKYEAK